MDVIKKTVSYAEIEPLWSAYSSMMNTSARLPIKDAITIADTVSALGDLVDKFATVRKAIVDGADGDEAIIKEKVGELLEESHELELPVFDLDAMSRMNVNVDVRSVFILKHHELMR